MVATGIFYHPSYNTTKRVIELDLKTMETLLVQKVNQEEGNFGKDSQQKRSTSLIITLLVPKELLE